MGDNDPPPGIRAGSLKATNVVHGVQFQGGDAQTTAKLVELARGIRAGTIDVRGEIEAGNVVSGLQYIADPSQATADDLRREVAALRTLLEQAVAEDGTIDPTSAQYAREALATAETELSASKPNGSRVVRKLGEVSDVLTDGAEAAENAGKIGTQLAKLAPVAAVLWQLARDIFGV